VIGTKKKGCIVTGKDIKSLIHRPAGVLVKKEGNLYFVGEDDTITLVLRGVCDKEKVILISDEFEKLQRLRDDEDYSIVFSCDYLEIWDKPKRNLIMVVDGILL
jgi:hypothetical protein